MSESIIEFFQRFSWLALIVILIFGWFVPILMFLTFICMIAPVVFSFQYGRAWCGNFCPRGSFNYNVLKIISPSKPIPTILKKPIVRFIAFILLMTLFLLNMMNSNGSLLGIGTAFIKMMAITTLIEIAMGIFLHYNSWCAICPMGSAASAITKLKGKAEGGVVITEECTGCQICIAVCPMEINIPGCIQGGTIRDSNCLKCRKCVKHCKNKALNWEM